jgi:hypothetical protein
MPPTASSTDEGNGIIMSKKIERTLASLLLALVAGGGSSKIH